MPSVHKTRRVKIKEAEIDSKMVPVVKWLNSYHSVNTFFCCEGDSNRHPYVIFSCYEVDDLLQILQRIRHYKVTCEVDWQLVNFPLRYRLSFEDCGSLDDFVTMALAKQPEWACRT